MTVPVIIVGAGPVGLSAAIDLASHGVSSVLLDDSELTTVGSRAICWSKRTLEIFDRLGIGDKIVAKGITWKIGRVYRGDREIYSFDLLPEVGHKMPAFINLQQYYVERFLAEQCRAHADRIDLRFQNRVVAVNRQSEKVGVTVETPEGTDRMEAQYLLACDGANSTIRNLLGLEFGGETFDERFLIADVKMDAEFPSERWFWFDPAFHPGQSALLHKQPDNIYRIDLQLDREADPEIEKQPDNVIPRIERAVAGRPFELDWVSVYRFRCCRLDSFLHGRVIFAGDSAHVVSPFGARGGNGGIQDVDNLCWKLATVLDGRGSDELLKTYDEERTYAADENIRHSKRTSMFMTPHSTVEQQYRNATLSLAENHSFARYMANAGRLSTPCALTASTLTGQDQNPSASSLTPGMPCVDAPVGDGWLLEQFDGSFVVMGVGCKPPSICGAKSLEVPCDGELAQRYGEGVYFIRPDQHVYARWQMAISREVEAAMQNALMAVMPSCARD